MATMHEDMEELAVCPICLDDFDHDERKPKLLPCQHILCLDCVQRLAASVNPPVGDERQLHAIPIARRSLPVPCPECRRDALIENLPDCLHTKKLIDVLVKEKVRIRQREKRSIIEAKQKYSHDFVEPWKSLVAKGEAHVNEVQEDAKRLKTTVDKKMDECLKLIEERRRQLHVEIDAVVLKMKQPVEQAQQKLFVLMENRKLGEELINKPHVDETDYDKYVTQLEGLKCAENLTGSDWNEQERVTVDFQDNVIKFKDYGTVKTMIPSPSRPKVDFPAIQPDYDEYDDDYDNHDDDDDDDDDCFVDDGDYFVDDGDYFADDDDADDSS